MPPSKLVLVSDKPAGHAMITHDAGIACAQTASPYIMMSQIVAGLDGIERRLDPGPQDLDPYAADRPPLPKSLAEALDALEASALFRRETGDVFMEWFLKLKRGEAGRFRSWLKKKGAADPPEEPTEWEHNEYFDFF